MRFCKSNKLEMSYDGDVLIKVTPDNVEVLRPMSKMLAGEHYNLNIGARILVDIEFYLKYLDDLVASKKFLANKINSRTKEVEEALEDIVKEEPINAEEVIAHLLKSKRSIHTESKSTNSKYTFGVYNGHLYEYRTSDHDKSHNQFSLSTTLKRIPFGVKLKVGTVTPVGTVTYSTEFKTTISCDGEKKHYLTSFVNEMTEKQK